MRFAAGAPYNRVLGNGTVYGKNFILAADRPTGRHSLRPQAIRKTACANIKKGAPVRGERPFLYIGAIRMAPP